VRARIILEQAEGQPFPTFDRIAMFDESAGKSLGDPLDAFAAAREANLAALSGLDITPEKLARKGIHPSLGTVTLGNLLATWARLSRSWRTSTMRRSDPGRRTWPSSPVPC
jgi:hypothetical protein